MKHRISYLEATARHRLAGVLDSFQEIIPPSDRRISPHLGLFDAPVAFDDGAIIGEGTVAGMPVMAFAQEGKFRGGALGEVHAAKITGLLLRAAEKKPKAVLALLDSGGVRLEEANAGEIGATEIMRAIFTAQDAGVPVIGLIGGSCGCFGGAGILASCCDVLIGSEEGRLSVSGPEVIETIMGVEAFDSRDKALVWRTTGGKNRFLFGKLTRLVEDNIPDFRDATIELLAKSYHAPTFEELMTERECLTARIEKFGTCKDALEIWTAMGLNAPLVPEMTAAELLAAKNQLPISK